MKKIISLFLVTLLMLSCVACSKIMTYKFNVSTGDYVAVTLSTDDEYTLTQADGLFVVNNEENNAVLQGFFVTKEMYESYLEAVNASTAEIIKESNENGLTYLQYQLVTDAHTENNFICWIDGSNTGVVIASTDEKEIVENVFDMLSFSY